MLPGPQDAAALVIDIPDAHQRRHLLNPVVGSCPCGEGLAKSFFTSQSSNNPARIDKPTVVVRCNDMSKLCVCDEEDRCYHPIGNSLDEVQLHSYCKDDGEMVLHSIIIVKLARDSRMPLLYQPHMQ